MEYTQIPVSTFEEIQLNAGILLDSFNPATGVKGNQLGATSGGINLTDSVEYSDYGDDIDNCPKNTLELKKLNSHEVKASGTFVTMSVATAKLMAGAADVDPNNENHIIPRNDLLTTDFKDIWWVGDYSDENTGATAGFIAIHLKNALSTGGFQIQSSDRAKGTFGFEFTAHYSINNQDEVPYEIYIIKGSSTVVPSINLDAHRIEIAGTGTHTLHVTKIPSNATVTFSSGNTSVATVGESTGVVTGAGAGNTIITASMTVDGVTYTDTCTAIVTAG